MEKGYPGGPALARDVARLVALFVKTQPVVVEALEERKRVRQHFEKHNVLHVDNICYQCQRIVIGEDRYCTGTCGKRCCSNCAPIYTTCKNGCCKTFIHANCNPRKCCVIDCAQGGCRRYGFTKCQNCPNSMCNEHRCVCPYCGKGTICQECAIGSRHDCIALKKFKFDDNN